MNAQPAAASKELPGPVVAYARRAVELQRRKPWVVDVAISIAFLIADLVELRFFHSILGPVGEIASWPVLVAIAVVRAGLLTFRRRFPLAVTFLVSATLITIPTGGLHFIFEAGSNPPDGSIMTRWWPNAIGYTATLEGLLTIYTVTALRGRRRGVIAALWFNLAWAPWLIPQFIIPAPQVYVLWVFISGLAVGLGNVRRRMLAALIEVRARSARIDQGRQRAARGAAQAERERVSLDLQALVSRNLRRMVEQAGVARAAIGSRAGTEAEHEALGAIEQTGRLALADARRALGLLRESGGRAPLTPASRVAAPGERDPSAASPSRPRGPSAGQRVRGASARALVPLLILGQLLLDMGFMFQGWPHGPIAEIGHPLDITTLSLMVGALAFRRTFPVSASLVVSLSFALQSTSHHIYGISALLAVLIGVYAAWAGRGPRLGWIAALGAALALPTGAWWLELYRFGLLTTYVPFLLGACLLGWQEWRLQLARRTLDEQEIALRRLAEEDLGRARTEERLRLARELHDVTAHSLSVMTIQAGAARTVVAKRPDQAQQALSAVEQAGLEAQVDLDQVFAVSGTDPGALNSLPGISSLPALAEQMTRAGLSVQLDTPDDLEPVSPGLDLSIYRVVQEALTNAAKHAGPTRVTVRVRTVNGQLLLEVEDEGQPPAGHRPPAPTDGGRGLVGMDERVRAFGGSLNAAPHGDGFAVRVRVPLVPEPALEPGP